MYNVTATFLEKVIQNDRRISGKLYLGDIELTDNDLIFMNMEYSLGNDSILAIGGVVASRIDVKLFRDKLPPVLTTQELKPYLGLEVSEGNIEYIPMGIFRINPRDTVKTDKTITLIGYDILYLLEDSPYKSDLEFPATWDNIKAELENKGLKFANQDLSNVQVKEKPNTIRELLSIVGELLGRNVATNRLGEIEFRGLNLVGFEFDNHRAFKLLADDEVKLTRLTVEKENEEDNLTYGNDTGYTIKIKNSSITTENELATVYNRAFPLSYIAYECQVKGYPHLDVGDIIIITDRHGVSRKVPVVYHKISYKGGLMSEIRANAPSGVISSTGSTGSRSITQSLNDLRVNILEVNHILADKADINLVVANEAKINDLYTVKANVSDLQATNARIGVLEVGYADISVLKANVADINTLLAGNLDASNMKAGFITADAGLIANAAITNAMIANVSADKIATGKINTNLVEIGSADGHFIIADNTLQINDGNKVRVQIGKDAQGDYSLSLWDDDGNLMFDARGLTEDAIKDEIIRNDMIASNANIDGSKLNISSVVQAINNSVTKIESSHINYDGKSLNVAFNELETNFNSLEIGGRNLLRRECMTNNNMISPDFSRYISEGIVIGKVAGQWNGIKNTNLNLEPNTEYVLHYKIKKTDGTLKNIGGHTDTSHQGQINFYIDGVRQPRPYSTAGVDLSSILNDGEFHTIEYYFKTPDTYDNSHRLDIQPNRGHDDYAAFIIADIKLEKGNKPTDWTPPPEDIQDEINTRVKITDFQIEQGRINTLISDVSTLEGEVNSTKSQISTIEQTIDTIGTTISELEIDVATTNSNLSQFVQDVNSFKFSVSQTYATKNELSSNVSTIEQNVNGINAQISTINSTISNQGTQIQSLNSQISVLQNQISLKVEQSDITNAINNIEIGGRNLIIRSTESPKTYINTSGQIVSNNNNCTSDYIEVEPNTNYMFSKGDTSIEAIGWFRWAWYDENKNYIARAADSRNEFLWTTPENVHFVRISYPYDCYPKFEKGNKATDWSPAPEDVSDEIETKYTELSQTIDGWKFEHSYLKSPKKIRYIRSHMRLKNGTTSSWVELTVLSNGVNVAINKPVIVGNKTGLEVGTPERYVDGSHDKTYIIFDQKSVEMPYLQVDLGKVYEIDSIHDRFAPSGDIINEYNYKFEVSEDGTSWYVLHDGVNNRAVNEFIFSGFQQGITTISGDGIKVEHSDFPGQYSEMRADGFIRKWQYGESVYLSDIYVAEYTREAMTVPNPDYILDYTPMNIPLPERFRGRPKDRVEAFLVPVNLFFWGSSFNSRGDVSYYNSYSTIILEVIDYYLDEPEPFIDINAIQYARISRPGESSEFEISDMTFLVIIISY